MKNMELWDNLKAVPATAKKIIQAGRLKGMTDIKPQWRLQMMTEQFGAIGIGWYYEPVKMWTETYGTEVSAHVQINLFVKIDNEWSKPISGTGGSMLIANENIKDYEKDKYDTKFKPYHSDEAYKMATTDALSVAMKQLGVAADVYMGLSDSKYDKPTEKPVQIVKASVKQKAALKDYLVKFQNNNDVKAIDYINESLIDTELTEQQADKIISHCKTKLGE